MPYYVSIKAYNSTVQEFCAVQLRLYGRVGATHFQANLAITRDDTKQQILRTESINTCNAKQCYTNLGYNREEVCGCGS